MTRAVEEQEIAKEENEGIARDNGDRIRAEPLGSALVVLI
jgi:hypothetical protein